jgi:uncharacterized protein YecE (DUF72 family)
MVGRTRIGCSSWTSDAWWGRIYPESLKDGDRLAWYAKLWDTVEVDSTYYRDPGPFLFRRWAASTPEDFVFAVKFPRDLLDPKREVDREKIARFLVNASQLGPKLGPILLQFPPWVRPGRATTFLAAVLDALDAGPRFSVELRDIGWFQGEAWEGLRRSLTDRGIALTWSYLTYVDVPPVLTSNFVYLRFIGDHTTVPAETHGEVRVDRSEAIRRWARQFQEALNANVQEGFAFFNNHFAGFAPQSVNEFREALGLSQVPFVLPGKAAKARLSRLD